MPSWALTITLLLKITHHGRSHLMRWELKARPARMPQVLAKGEAAKFLDPRLRPISHIHPAVVDC